jgi:hypothetical protein
MICFENTWHRWWLVWAVAVAKAEEPVAFFCTGVTRVRTHGPFALLLTQADEPPLVAGQLRVLLAKQFAITFESSSTSRTRRAVKIRARPPAQRKGMRSQKVAGNVGGRERSDLIIVGESKSERVGPLSGEWEIGLVVECAVV